MNILFRLIKPALMIAFIIAGTAVSLQAQTGWLYPLSERGISLEIFKGDFSRDYDFTFATSNMFLTGHFPVSDALSIIFELPYSHVDRKNSDFDSQNLLGNPYIGIKSSPLSSGTIFSAGMRVPMAPDNRLGASETGIIVSFNRFEAFIPDLFTIGASIGGRSISPDNIIFESMIGPTMLMPTEGGDGELYIDYRGELWIKTKTVDFGFGLSGRYLLTESDLSFGERTVHIMGFAVNLSTGRLQPGIHFRAPLDDDLQDVLDFVYGINFAYRFED